MIPGSLGHRALGGVMALGALVGLVALVFLVAGSPGVSFGFGVLGAGCVGLGWAGRRLTGPPGSDPDADASDDAVEAVRRRWAGEPWTRRADWAEGRVIQEGPAGLGLLIGFTVAWNVIAWGIAGLAIGSQWGVGDMPWFVLLFPGIGVLLAVVTGRIWIRRRKFGTSVLTLDGVPIRVGGRLRGRLETGVRARLDEDVSFRARLRCVERREYQDADGDSRVAEEELWSEDARLRPETGGGAAGGLAVPIDLAVPEGLPPTEMAPSANRVVWRLEVTASVPGVDYAARFELPVFRERGEGPGLKP